MVVRGIEGKSAFKEARFPVIGTLKRTKTRFAHIDTDYAHRASCDKGSGIHPIQMAHPGLRARSAPAMPLYGYGPYEPSVPYGGRFSYEKPS